MIEHIFEQRSPGWHAWRDGGVGASEAAVLQGDSPWMCSQDLWELKKGIRPQQAMNFAMQRGVDDEPLALSHYENMTGNIMEPLCATHDTHPFILASLDGITPARDLHAELKCPGMKSHLMALAGIVPMYYKWQIQQQLLVTGNPMGHYFSFLKNHPDPALRGTLIEVHADLAMQEEIIEQSRIFMDHLKDNKPMYPLEWSAAAREWLIAQEEVAASTQLLEARRERLIAIADSKPMKGSGVSLGVTVYKPPVDWDGFYAAEVVKDPSLDLYVEKSFNAKKYEKEVKPQPDLLAPYLMSAKEPNIVIRKINNAVDNAILENSTKHETVYENPPVITPSFVKDSFYDF